MMFPQQARAFEQDGRRDRAVPTRGDKHSFKLHDLLAVAYAELRNEGYLDSDDCTIEFAVWLALRCHFITGRRVKFAGL